MDELELAAHILCMLYSRQQPWIPRFVRSFIDADGSRYTVLVAKDEGLGNRVQTMEDLEEAPSVIIGGMPSISMGGGGGTRCPHCQGTGRLRAH